MTCFKCETKLQPGDVWLTIDGDEYCGTCAEELDWGECSNCGELHFSDSLTTAGVDMENNVCVHCLERDYFRCVGCDVLFHLDMMETDGLCRNCDGGDENEIAWREVNLGLKKYQSKEPGRVIQSLRKFGLEIEVMSPKIQTLVEASKDIDTDFGIEWDGSIEPRGSGIEIVTPIMSGKAGEKAVRYLYDKIKQHQLQVNNTCGLHVHLDAPEFLAQNEVRMVQVSDASRDLMRNTYNFVVDSDYMEYLQKETGQSVQQIGTIIHDQLEHGPAVIGDRIYLRHIFRTPVYDARALIGHFTIKEDESGLSHEVPYITQALKKHADLSPWDEGMAQKAKSDDLLIAIPRSKNLERLKTLLYLHAVYSDVFLAMLPLRRRQKNRYCKKLSTVFSPAEIRNFASFEEVEKAWYREKDRLSVDRRKGQRYDESRYHGVNLHALFAKYGTLEVRYHSATLSARKAIYWVALLQEMTDKIAMGEISIRHLREGEDLYYTEDKAEYLIRTLRLRKPLEKYMRMRLNYFSNKKNN